MGYLKKVIIELDEYERLEINGMIIKQIDLRECDFRGVKMKEETFLNIVINRYATRFTLKEIISFDNETIYEDLIVSSFGMLNMIFKVLIAQSRMKIISIEVFEN